MSTGRELGPLVRRWGLPVKQLPAATAGSDELRQLVTAILEEALPFIDSAAAISSSPDARKLWISKGGRSSADSEAKVEVLERVVPAKTLQAVAAKHGVRGKVEEETWAARLSVHEDAPRKGTASWEEFDRAFRLEHGKTEMAFTPDVIGANEAQRWDCGDIETEAAGHSWEKFSLVVEEMRHKVGRPVLKDRTFPVLQMSCAARDADEFVIVSIPVPDFATSEHADLSKEKGAQIAYYVSIERIRKLEDGRIEWLLGTASDAAGALPLWIQDKALPGIVWKDVPLFLGWIAKERGKMGINPPAHGATEEPEKTSQTAGGVAADPSVSESDGGGEDEAVVVEVDRTPEGDN